VLRILHGTQGQPQSFVAGVELAHGSKTFRCQGKVGYAVQDYKAHVEATCFKTASGTLPCCMCQNITQNVSGLRADDDLYTVGHHSHCLTCSASSGAWRNTQTKSYKIKSNQSNRSQFSASQNLRPICVRGCIMPNTRAHTHIYIYIYILIRPTKVG